MHVYTITLTLYDLDMGDEDSLDMMTRALHAIQGLGVGDVETDLSWQAPENELNPVEP